MTPDRASLERSISAATRAMLDCQKPDGEWCFELEADCTIPAEYVLLRHYLGEPVDAELERKIAVYLRRTQSGQHGGWPLFRDGEFDVSATVKAYFALKMIGDSVDAPHMAQARREIRTRGGAAGANIFTRLCWRCSASFPGARCRRCRSRSCCSRNGFHSISTRFRIGAAPSLCRCWC